MKAYVIEISNNIASVNGVKTLLQSSSRVKNDFEIQRFVATTPENTNLDAFLKEKNLVWNYPLTGEEYDFYSGLKKTAYKAANPSKVIACFISHYRLWEACVLMNENILILEHDAIFTQKLDKVLYDYPRIISLNNPLGCTRLSRRYDEMLKTRRKAYDIVPYIDSDISVPQGLPGNSAYIISPQGAKELIALCRKYGAWPNDAIMCRQLMEVHASKIYYTHIQGLRSTTTC